MWWRAAFYGWGYPSNPDGKPDSPLCPDCGPQVIHPWEPGFVVVTYTQGVVIQDGEKCFRCGVDFYQNFRR